MPDAERVMKEYLADGYNVIWSPGSQYFEATSKLAKQNPDVTFIGEFDNKPKEALPNLWVLDRNFHVAFYPIGVLAGATTKSGKIGYVGGLSLPFSYSEVHAINQALKDTGSSAKVTPVWTGDFNEPAKAQQITTQLIGQGNDVIVGSLNLGMVGAFQATKGKDADVVVTAKYTDKSQFDPEHYATSTIYDFTKPLNEMLTKIQGGTTSGYFPWASTPASRSSRRRTSRPRLRPRSRRRWPTSRPAPSRSRRTSPRSSDGRQHMTSVEETRRDVAQGSSGPLLSMEGIRKTFGPVVALDGVDLTVGRSEVHGLLGGNGAGKTTLMNVLYGLYRPDGGTVLLDGAPVDIRDPRDAISHGIGMVHQNFLQVDTYTVTENIVLGTSLPSWPAVDLKAPAARIAELSERFGLTVDPQARVADLSVGLRQRVEILKALYRGAKVLVLDEPTTNLTPQEVDSLFGSLRAIVDEGMSVVFITHKIRETMAVCDALTVMRDGKRVGTLRRADTSAAELATLMVGDDAAVTRVTEVVTAGMGAPEAARPPAPRSSTCPARPGPRRCARPGLGP